MSAESNLAMWKAIGDTRSREDRIREARGHNTKPRDRRRNAIEIDKANSGKTPQERLAELDYRLGKNAGAVKERKRLNEDIAK